MNLVETLVHYRRFRLVKWILSLLCIEFPASVRVGNRLRIVHRGFGLVVHPLTDIGNDVTLYHGVTVGRADAHIPFSRSAMEKIVIEDEVVLFPGCIVLGGPGVTRISRGTIIAANAVLTQSTQENEIWGGVPAKRIGVRISGSGEVSAKENGL